MAKGKVLCIDDDSTVAVMVADIAEFCGCSPIIETDSMEVVTKYLNDEDIVAVLCDYMMPRLDGIELLTIWQEQRPSVRRVLITAAPHEVAVRTALKEGIAQLVVAKPCTVGDIKLALSWL